jgi:hypothetical protein
LRDVGVNRMAVLKLILKKYDKRMWDGIILAWVGSSGNII